MTTQYGLNSNILFHFQIRHVQETIPTRYMQQGYRRYVPENPKHISALVIYSAPINHFVILSNKLHLKLNIVLFLFIYLFFLVNKVTTILIHSLSGTEILKLPGNFVFKVTIISSFTLFYIYNTRQYIRVYF